MKSKKGVIYILTNPSFPDFIKIGYASDLEKRLSQLNRSETIPFAFRAYAIYEVSSTLTDKQLHKLIDTLMTCEPLKHLMARKERKSSTL